MRHPHGPPNPTGTIDNTPLSCSQIRTAASVLHSSAQMSTATLGLASNSSVVASTYKWFVERVGCNIETKRPLFLPASVTGSSNMIRQWKMPPSSRYDVRIPAKAPVSTRSRRKAASLELTRHRPAWRAAFGRTPCSTNFAKSAALRLESDRSATSASVVAVPWIPTAAGAEIPGSGRDDSASLFDSSRPSSPQDAPGFSASSSYSTSAWFASANSAESYLPMTRLLHEALSSRKL